ncbi:MAG: hypothetical protein ABSG31_17010 [Tepidisphaeraceae bacterium]
MTIDPETFRSLKMKRPFEAFRIFLTDGTTIDVVGPWKFTAMEDRLVVTPDGKQLKMIPYGQISRIEMSVAV